MRGGAGGDLGLPKPVSHLNSSQLPLPGVGVTGVEQRYACYHGSYYPLCFGDPGTEQ